MAYSAGQILTAANLNARVPEADATTWAGPISSGITVGSGSTVAFNFRVGPFQFCYFKFTFGAGSAITGNVVLDLPVDAAVQRSVIDSAYFLDSNVPAVRLGVVLQGAATTTVEVQSMSDASSPAVGPAALSSTSPFTWATGDIIVTQFQYYTGP